MLSHADQTTKDMIQRSFTIFQSRWQVMFHIFATNGNGLEWDDGGKVFDPYAKDDDNNDMKYFANRCEPDHHDIALGREPDKVAALQFHTMIAEFYKENLDTIASTMSTHYFEPFMKAPTYASIREFVRSPTYSLLGNAIKIKEANPEWEIEESWQKAITETIDVIRSLIFKECFAYWGDDPVTCENAWLDKKAFKVYDMLLQWKLELVPMSNVKEKALGRILETLESRDNAAKTDIE